MEGRAGSLEMSFPSPLITHPWIITVTSSSSKVMPEAKPRGRPQHAPAASSSSNRQIHGCSSPGPRREHREGDLRASEHTIRLWYILPLVHPLETLQRIRLQAGRRGKGILGPLAQHAPLAHPWELRGRDTKREQGGEGATEGGTTDGETTEGGGTSRVHPVPTAPSVSIPTTPHPPTAPAMPDLPRPNRRRHADIRAQPLPARTPSLPSLPRGSLLLLPAHPGRPEEASSHFRSSSASTALHPAAPREEASSHFRSWSTSTACTRSSKGGSFLPLRILLYIYSTPLSL